MNMRINKYNLKIIIKMIISKYKIDKECIIRIVQTFIIQNTMEINKNYIKIGIIIIIKEKIYIITMLEIIIRK